MKEENTQEFHGSASIGLVASKLTLEGPIIKDKISFIVSGRRTYIDVLAQPFIKKSFENNGNEGSTGYFFYDLNAKVNHKFSNKDRLYLSFYGGKDKFYFNEREKDNVIQDYYDNRFG
ncbi:MAG: outer membrane receptor for ferrienterochelin and colicin [Saprospiraceae bacterium]|jgi:outer membrane receptor for ferrienterochelin and colicin